MVFQMAHSKLASYILPLFPALALMTGNFLGNGLSQIQHRKKMQNLLCASFAILAVLGIAVMAGHKAYPALYFFPITDVFSFRFFDRLSGH